MKTVMLLLVPFVGMLISLSFAGPVPILHQIIDLANVSLTKDIMVDDVEYLAEGTNKCGDQFFCKVHEVLNHVKKVEKHTKPHEVGALERTVRGYLNSTNVDCNLTENHARPSVETKRLSVLMKTLISCCQHKNFRAS